MRTPEEKTSPPQSFKFITTGQVDVQCGDCGRLFHLGNSFVGDKEVACVYCLARATVPAEIMAFHKTCEGES